MTTPLRKAIQWLDFDEKDLSAARALLKLLSEEGVLDELGFSVLQEKFSDLLYPATTTQMRSSRYLYFVASIYRRLEEEKTPPSQVERRARKLQQELSAVLSKTHSQGVIGVRRKGDPVQPPSAIYWGSLRKLGFFLGRHTEQEYRKQFGGRLGDVKTDDGDVSPRSNPSLWDGKIPQIDMFDSRGRIVDGLTFELTEDEACDLRRRYLSRFDTSLLTEVLKRGRPRKRDYPWELSALPGRLETILEHARCLSLFVRGVQLQYFSILIEELEKRGKRGQSGQYDRPFDIWYDGARASLLKWQPREMGDIAEIASGLSGWPREDVKFIEAWIKQLEACGSSDELFNDARAKKLVREREPIVKAGKSRLANPKYLRQWKPPGYSEHIHQFDYRHQIGSRFVREIIEGLPEAGCGA